MFEEHWRILVVRTLKSVPLSVVTKTQPSAVPCNGLDVFSLFAKYLALNTPFSSRNTTLVPCVFWSTPFRSCRRTCTWRCAFFRTGKAVPEVGGELIKILKTKIFIKTDFDKNYFVVSERCILSFFFLFH